MTDRDRMAAAGLVPVSFDPPPLEHGCPGSLRLSKPQLFGICHLCERLGNDGPQVEPAARLVQGVAQCLNFLPLDADHVAEHEAAEPAGVCLSVGGMRYAPESGFRNAGVTPQGAGE